MATHWLAAVSLHVLWRAEEKGLAVFHPRVCAAFQTTATVIARSLQPDERKQAFIE